MRALTGYPTRALALTVLVVTAGTVFGWGQSPTNNKSAAAPAHAKVVDLTPASLSGETNQDSEPFLAVQAANPQIMVASASLPIRFPILGMPPYMFPRTPARAKNHFRSNRARPWGRMGHPSAQP